jgi:hypothetical protein
VFIRLPWQAALFAPLAAFRFQTAHAIWFVLCASSLLLLPRCWPSIPKIACAGALAWTLPIAVAMPGGRSGYSADRVGSQRRPDADRSTATDVGRLVPVGLCGEATPLLASRARVPFPPDVACLRWRHHRAWGAAGGFIPHGGTWMGEGVRQRGKLYRPL